MSLVARLLILSVFLAGIGGIGACSKKQEVKIPTAAEIPNIPLQVTGSGAPKGAAPQKKDDKSKPAIAQ